MQQININELKPHPRNNEFFDDMSGEKWNEFLESIKSRGVIEPIVITPDKVIVSGHQRVRACKELGIDTVMCDVHEYKDDEDVFLNMLLSNLDRVKEIPSELKRIEIFVEIEKIYKKREQKIKKERDCIVKNFRNEITKYKDDILDYHNGQCDICKFNLKSLLEIHHILPLQQGGDNSLDNIACLCPNCHSIAHKYISLYYNNADIKDVFEWVEENYTKSSNDKLFKMYETFVERKCKYGWEELTWI